MPLDFVNRFNLTIAGDINSDGRADCQIALTGDHSPHTTDVLP